MIVVGILGGIASGKSLVADQFQQLGAEIVNADQIGHEILSDPEIQQAIRQRWGSAVIDSSGQVDRQAVARIVFAPPPAGPLELEYLEQLTHPEIGRKIRERVEQLKARADVEVLVLDAALILKAGWVSFCDKIIFVETSFSQRLAWAAARGWDESELAAREASQEPLIKKRQVADFIIQNDGTPEDVLKQVRAFLHSLN